VPVFRVSPLHFVAVFGICVVVPEQLEFHTPAAFTDILALVTVTVGSLLKQSF
jgi:hypothetical protein